MACVCPSSLTYVPAYGVTCLSVACAVDGEAVWLVRSWGKEEGQGLLVCDYIVWLMS